MLKTLLERNNVILLLTICFLFLTATEFINVFMQSVQGFNEDTDWIENYSYFSLLGKISGFLIAALLLTKITNYKGVALFASILFAGTSYLILFMLNGEQLSAENKDVFIFSFFFTNSFLMIVLVAWLLARLKALDNSYIFAVATVIMASSELSYVFYDSFSDQPDLYGEVLFIASIIIFFLLAVTTGQPIQKSDDNKPPIFSLISLFILNVLFWIVYFIIDAKQYNVVVFFEEIAGFNPVVLYACIGIAISLKILKYLYAKQLRENQFPTITVLRFCMGVMLLGLLVISYELFRFVTEEIGILVTSILLVLKTTASITFGAVSLYLIVKNIRSQFMIWALMLWLVTPLILGKLWWSMGSEFTYDADFIIRLYIAIIIFIIAFMLQKPIKNLVTKNGGSSYQYSQLGYQWKEIQSSRFSFKIGFFNKFKQLFSLGSFVVRLALAGILLIGMDLGRVIGLYSSQVACQSLNDATFVVMAELIAGYFIFIGLFSRFAAIILIALCYLQIHWLDGLFVSNAYFEKDADTLFIVGLLASYIVIFGSGVFSLKKIVKEYNVSSLKLAVIIVAGSFYSLIIFLQADQEQVEISFYKNSYTRVSLGVSQAAIRREQIVYATLQLQIEIYGSVLKPYLQNGYNMPTKSTDLIFLNEFIETDYPDIAYRVVVNDIWQEPFILNPQKAEIRSSGPDKIMNTEDDIVFVDGQEHQDDHRKKSLISWILNKELEYYDLYELQYHVWGEKDELYGAVKSLDNLENVICTSN